MKLTRTTNDRSIIINTEQDFQTNLGWEENLVQLEDEVLKDIINPADNYETVRYIHKEYDRTISGITIQQTDIWFNFYFLSGTTYVQNYEADNVDIKNRENELMLRQSTESFFRLEFFKTPQKTWKSDVTYGIGDVVYYIASTMIDNVKTYTGNTYTSTVSNNINNNPQTGTGWTLTNTNTIAFEPPSRKNRRLVFTKNLSLPLGEKFIYTNVNSIYKIHLPIFTGSNYRNKENMYLFWFEDETVLEDTNLIGTSSGNTFFMTSKFYNAKDGSVIDFNNRVMSTGDTIDERYDMYYQVDFDLLNRTYCVHTFTGGTPTFHIDCNVSSRRGNNLTGTSINFYEKGGGTLAIQPTYVAPTPTPTPIPGLEDQVDFVITKTCVGQIAYVTIGSGSGGSGVHQFGQSYYSSSTDASTSTNFNYSDGETWSNIPDGTWYFVMRDNSDYNNKVVKSVVVDCDTNPPDCVTGVTFNITAVPQEMFYQDCGGTIKSVMYTTTGYKTIVDCLQVNSLNSYDYNYDNVTYATETCLISTPTPTPTATSTPTPTPTPTIDPSVATITPEPATNTPTPTPVDCNFDIIINPL